MDIVRAHVEAIGVRRDVERRPTNSHPINTVATTAEIREVVCSIDQRDVFQPHIGGIVKAYEVRPMTACGVLNQQCEVTVRSAVVALQCEGGSVSRSGARHCEHGFARRRGF